MSVKRNTKQRVLINARRIDITEIVSKIEGDTVVEENGIDAGRE